MKSPFTFFGLSLAILAAAPPAAAQGPDGKALYAKNCRSCHGQRGTPPAALAKQLKVPTMDAAYIAARSEDSLFNVIKKGGKNMKPVNIPPEEMKAIVAYMKVMFATPGPAQ